MIFFFFFSFEVQHSTDLQNWSAFQNFEVVQSGYDFASATTTGGDTANVNMGTQRMIELSFDPVNAKGIKIIVTDPWRADGNIYIYEIYVYEVNSGTTMFFVLYSSFAGCSKSKQKPVFSLLFLEYSTPCLKNKLIDFVLF
jgi:hypothetical protein